MHTALSPGAVQVKIHGIEDALDKAARHGFEAVELGSGEVADRVDQEGAESLLSLFAQKGVKPAGWGVPFDWRGSEEAWREGLAQLPRHAKAMASIGATRVTTWILSFSNDRDQEANRAFHIQRLKPVAEILGEHGCRFGLEFLGPKTMRESGAYPFLYHSYDMLAMARETAPNVGLLVDAWHWHTADETVADLEKLTADDVVYVHVNDAPEGVALEDFVDNVRRLPGETGVIDIASFLGALRKIGYEGPVAAEPFKKELGDLPDDEARLAATRESLRKIGL